MDINIELSNGQILRGTIRNHDRRMRAMVIMIHGLGEHIGRYSMLADKFMQEEIGFMGVDLPGHGLSDGSRGHIRDYQLLYEMADILYGESSNRFPGIPLFIYGHSLGGGIVLNYLLRKDPEIHGAIVSSPWLKLAFEPSPSKKKLAALTKKFFPALTMSNGLIPEHLSRDNNIVKEYLDDPLVHDRISVSLIDGAFSAADEAMGEASKLKKPVLIMHGTDDKICSPAGSAEFASKTGMVQLKIWEGGFHELHNDLNKSDVVDHTISWINSRLS